MNVQKSFAWFIAVTLLGLVTALASVAGPPSAPWVGRDFDDPSKAGSSDVDPNGVWTISGSGRGIWHFADQFYFVYQPVRGDASISARFLNIKGGNEEWARIGLMVRENDSAESPNFHFHMTPTTNAQPQHGLVATMRSEPNGRIANFGTVGPNNSPETNQNLHMRLQRVGNEITGFYSRDGSLWTQAGVPPQVLPTLQEEALIGLSVTAHSDGEVTTAQLDQVSLQPGVVSPYGVNGCGFNTGVALQWRPVPNAVAYNIYRGPAGATRDQLVKVNTNQVSGTVFADTSAALANGTPVTYAVAAVTRGANSNLVEGPPVGVRVTPVTTPPGWMGCSINEVREVGSAAYDPVSGEVTLRGSGGGIGVPASAAVSSDEYYFLSQALEGDATVTAHILTPPTPSGRAGIVLRESYDGGARNVGLWITETKFVLSTVRPATNGPTDTLLPVSASNNLPQLPIVLRLTRKGNRITAQYSKDQGKTFLSAGGFTFSSALPQTLYAGPAITAGSRTRVSEARFTGLHIQR